MPIAVNVDTRESTVRSMLSAESDRILKDTGVTVVRSRDEILAGMEDVRESRSLWRILMMAGLAFFVIESLVAELMSKRSVANT